MNNKEKVRMANRKYYKKNIEKIKEYNKKWAKQNPLSRKNTMHKRRTINVIQKFTQKQLEQRMSVFGFRCAYCGGNFDHIDHVKSIKTGGPHCLSNLRPACRKCNLEKGAKSLSAWLNSLSSVSRRFLY
jgi:5-methylcytosine-specific restriction endonuclease McrA